jgi:hypothetical protein
LKARIVGQVIAQIADLAYGIVALEAVVAG